MEKRRLLQTMKYHLIRNNEKKNDYLRKKNIVKDIGEHVVLNWKIIPLYPQLLKFGNNIMLGSGVRFLTHDAIHHVFHGMNVNLDEYVGCIEIGDNVFIGADSSIMSNVRIGNNVIIGANSLVTKDVPNNSVACGVPARVIMTFEDFVEKRSDNNYPIVRINQHITEEEIRNAWLHFAHDHEEKDD